MAFTSTIQHPGEITAPPVSLSQTLAAAVPALLALWAAFFTGAHQEWSYAVFVAGLGLFLLTRPHVHNLYLWSALFLLVFWLWPLLSFTPARWWHIPQWRINLEHDLDIKVGALLTPQPALTLEHWLFLTIGVLWFYGLAAIPWTRESRSTAITTYSIGVTFIASTSFLCEFLKWRFPFWDAHAVFGPFANRNQTANLFALAGILILACDYQDASSKRKWTLLWFPCLGIVTAALVQTYSRAGIILFFGGAAFWTVWLLLAARSAAKLSLAITVILLLLSLFFIFGGKTLQRFTHSSKDMNPGSLRRWQIHQDTFPMIKKSPIAGYGLGNFPYLFTFYREKSVSQDRVIHPESDYLWLIATCGWPALLWLACIFLTLLPRWKYLRQHTDYPLRGACLAAGATFVLHGLVDVSGHRFGTIIPALFLFSLSLGSPSAPKIFKKSYLGLGQFAGLILSIASLLWICSVATQCDLLPSTRAATSKAQAEELFRTSQLPLARERNLAAASWIPLEWSVYFQRAQIDLAATPPVINSAAKNFRRARFLEPHASFIAMAEAAVWLPINPTYALAAWREAIERASPDKVFDVLSEIMTKSIPYPDLHASIKSVAESRPDLSLIFWQRCTSEELTADLRAQLLNPEAFSKFSPEQKKALFNLWIDHADLGLLEAAITAHPEWQKYAWRGLAREAAHRHDYERAWKFVQQFAPAPKIPANIDSRDQARLQQLFMTQPDNPATALALYQVQIRRDLKDDALQTIQQALAYPSAPPFFLYLKACLLADTQKWQEAWESWEKYETVNQK